MTDGLFHFVAKLTSTPSLKQLSATMKAAQALQTRLLAGVPPETEPMHAKQEPPRGPTASAHDAVPLP